MASVRVTAIGGFLAFAMSIAIAISEMNKTAIRRLCVPVLELHIPSTWLGRKVSTCETVPGRASSKKEKRRRLAGAGMVGLALGFIVTLSRSPPERRVLLASQVQLRGPQRIDDDAQKITDGDPGPCRGKLGPGEPA
jgi:hypothetical protein